MNLQALRGDHAAVGRVRPAHQAHVTHVTTANFKYRYAGGAFLVVVLAAAAVSGVLALRHAADTRTLSARAERTTRERLDPELQARAQSIAAHAADSLIGALRAADVNGVARRLQPFLDDATLSEISVTGSSGRRLFAWQRSAGPAPGALSAEVTAPVRAVIDGIPQTLGTVTVSLEQAAPVSGVSLAGRLQVESAGRTRLTWLLMVALAGSAALLAAALAWHVTQRLQRPVDSLIRSAERIGQGDYTRPVEVRAHDALAELQQALERMRGRLRQSTINKNYLHSVLNSMTDGVFVTSPDGVIKVANLAACKLLGYAEEELLGRSILAVLEERERAGFDLLQAAQETRETVVGRLAGDEFALFVDGLSADADNRGPIAQLAKSLLTEICRPFQLNQQEVFLTASVGIAFCPRDAENVIDLIRNADAAMYYSKQNGGNTFAFYSPEMNAAAVERLMLKSKLRRALERDELEIRYQPKVDLRNGKIIGAEALLRWRLPGHGDIPPSHFIPLAEETNLILDIGEWVLNRVCLDYRQMQSKGGDPGRISLNLSLKQLRQASFILRCRSVFRRHNVSPTAFELEITETTLMADPQRTVRLLDELYAMGLHLSIDDFGTGYSSLSALQQFPIGTLKIDQSFVRDATDDAGDATIVRTIIEMGRSLGMEVIAEGVESQRQLEFLRSNACHYGQGRLFGEPCTAEDLLGLLARQAAGSAPFAHLLQRADAVASRSA